MYLCLGTTARSTFNRRPLFFSRIFISGAQAEDLPAKVYATNPIGRCCGDIMAHCVDKSFFCWPPSLIHLRAGRPVRIIQSYQRCSICVTNRTFVAINIVSRLPTCARPQITTLNQQSTNLDVKTKNHPQAHIFKAKTTSKTKHQ